MPRRTFSGVRLTLIGDMSVTVSYPDIVSLETFVKMKDACDDIHQPKLVSETEGKSNGNGKGNP